MKKRRRRFSFFRFTILFIIAFGITYLFSDVKIPNFMPSGSVVIENEADDSLSERVKRALFIKEAVKKRMEGKTIVKINDMPRDLVHAIVAVEDSRFYTHHGFDIESIGRATLVNLESGSIEEGASTITQQLIKNLFLSSEQTFDRKIEELILAFSLEMVYEKEEILELYLNTIYFGSNFYGIKDAAKGYFDKEPKDLTLEESALLAGLPNAPSLYSPYVDLNLAKKRQHIVIDAMEKNGYIISSTAQKAKDAPLYFARETYTNSR